MKNYFCYIFIVLLICMCSKTKEDDVLTINNFPPSIQLKGIPVFEDVLGKIFIKKVDSLIIISTAADKLIQVYDKQENLIASFGKIGRGPNEFSYPPFIYDAIEEYSSSKLFAYDSHLKKLLKINLATSIDSNKIIVDEEYEFPMELSGARDIFYVNKKKLVGIYDDHFYQQLDKRRGGFYFFPESGKYETFKMKNFDVEPYEAMSANNINARIPAISPDRTKLAIVFVYSPLLEVYKIDENSNSPTPTKYLLGSNPPENKFKLEDFKDEELIEYYKFLYATKNKIYLLYYGKKYSDAPEQTYIQVLDWKGNALAQYLIPAKYGIDLFFVDEDQKDFYGLSYSNDAVYKFNYDIEK